MSFLYPLGFLALIGIPVLILIYIIKNRYTEQTIASTYLWTLSEKFLKRRVPINRITGIINLILQILAVILIAVVLAHPILSIPDAAKEYCFILDASGSMNIVQNDKTRFDAAKEKIAEIIDDSMLGSSYTLIYVGSSTDKIYENYTDKERALEILNDLEVSYSDTSLSDAKSIAQQYFSDYPSVVTYLVTDRIYSGSDNVNIINITNEGANCGISDIEYAIKDNKLYVNGQISSYLDEATVSVSLYFDNSEEAYATLENLQVNERRAVKEDGDFLLDEEGNFVVDPKEGDSVWACSFEFSCDQTEFSSIKVRINEADSLNMDNEATVFNVKHENVSPILYVSDTTTFMGSALKAALGISSIEDDDNLVTTIATAQYASQPGYGLYVFEGFVPESMPKEGAIWFINPTQNVEGANFSFQGVVNANEKAAYSTSTSTTIRNMLKGTSKESFGISKYVKVGLSSKFSTLITCEGNPLLFAGTNIYGNREVVFAFDLRDSARFTLLSDCTTLVSNMLSYSFPEVVDDTSFYCGDILQVNMISGCQGVRIESPLGNVSYPDTTAGISEEELTEVGVYNIYLMMKDNSERHVTVYASLPKLERQTSVVENSEFILEGMPEEAHLFGIIDDLMIIFIILAVIAVADYGVYCYEQYQLR